MISIKQRIILEALRDKSMSRKDLSPAVGIYASEMTNLLTVLRKYDYISYQQLASKERLITITEDGTEALLGKLKVLSSDTAQPNRINIFTLPTYHTPQSYARNDGNVHIASRGWV